MPENSSSSESEPVEIPLPSALDPQRGHLLSSVAGGSDEDRTDLLQKSLGEASEYGQQLWHTLDDIRHYLLDTAPTDGRTAARPTGPDDEAGWLAWQQAFGAVTSALAGPRGDSGFGEQEAAREALARRSAPASSDELAVARSVGWQPAPAASSQLRTVLVVAGIALTVRELAGRLWRQR